jgi:TonB-dependent receptor
MTLLSGAADAVAGLGPPPTSGLQGATMAMGRSKRNLLVTAMALPFVAGALPHAALAQTDTYSVNEDDLGAALATLADESGRTIVYSASSVAGRHAGHVAGTHSLDEALHAVLAGSGLVATTRPDGTIVIGEANGAANARNDSIVVSGKRAAASIQLTSNTAIAVLTATDITRAPDTNVTETLSRLPGVNILYGGGQNTNGVSVDFAARGEGNLVALRGLDPEYNINTINDVEVAQGRPYSRGVELNLLPPQGMQQIVVNKSFSPEQDGDAIGGIIDFRTPTAFDFGSGLHGSFNLKGSLNSQEAAYDRQHLDYSIGGGLSWRNRDGTFGIYASGYYDHHKFANTIIDGGYPAITNGEYRWALADANGNSAAGVNPENNLVLTGLNVGATMGDVKRYGGSLAIDWRPTSEISAYLNATLAHSDVVQDTNYLQIYGQNISYAENGTSGTYSPVISNIQPRYYFTTEPEQSVMGTVSAGVNVHSGKWTVRPQAFVSWGIDNSDHIEVSGRQPEVGYGTSYGGSSLFGYSNGIPYPTLSASEMSQLENISSYGQRRAGEISPETSNQTKYGGKIDASYDMGDGVLRRIAFGAKISTSVRNHTYRDYTTATVFDGTSGAGPTLAQSGLLSGQVNQIAPGYYNFAAPLFSESALFNAFNAAAASAGGLNATIDTCSGLVINNLNCNTQHGTETVYAAYAMAQLKIADLDITPGARFEHTAIKNWYWVTPTDGSGNEIAGYFDSSSTRYDRFLPSIQVNYRPNALTVLRGSVSTSYVRPSLFQLGGGEQIAKSDSGTTITKGNPNLKPIDAINFDVSGEWTNNRFASASLGGFYKALRNFTYSQVNTYTNEASSADTSSTTTTQPLNGGNGHVEGIEAAARVQFKMLPAPFDGLGLGGNVTLEHSSVHLVAGSDATDRLLNQPDFSGNLLVFYYRGPIMADFTLSHTGAYVTQYNVIADIDQWVQANNRVDLHLGYATPIGARIDFGIANLFDTASYHATVGRYSGMIPSYVFSGRTFSLALKYAF